MVRLLLLPIVLLIVGVTIPPPDPNPRQESGDRSRNPFMNPYETPFNAPPLDRIQTPDLLPAVKEGIRRQQAEIDAIVAEAAGATFANTVAALDSTGRMLADVSAVFAALQGAASTPELQAVAKEIAPLMASHSDNIRLNERLFARIRTVFDRRESLGLQPDELFLLENIYRQFVRGGSLLIGAQRERLRELNRELAVLTLRFGENLLAETNAFRLVIGSREDLAGLPSGVVAMAEATAKQLGMEGKWVFTTQTPSMIPFLQYSTKRPLREKLHRAYFMRGDNNNDHDNKEIVRRIVTLRTDRARLLGYASHAHFVLEQNMARTPEAVEGFIRRLWEPSVARARQEAAEMQAIVETDGEEFKMASWDWWFYAEKLRQKKYALDDAALRPYFSLENVRKGIFALCDRLYGLKFSERKDVPVYNPEVQVYEVHAADGSHVGVLYMDFHPRPGKRGGAWSGALRRQHYANGERVPPLATIVCNFTRPTAEAPSLLSVDEVKTFFHEFGHALATLLSDGRFRDRTVPRDAVELPSQIMENWALEPEMLASYARHYQSGAPIPAELVTKLRKSSLFNQGFESVEYLAASMLDMAWHTLSIVPPDLDVNAFERREMQKATLPPEIVPRYRSTYFNHIFNGAYSAGYYVYIWAEQLDADAFEAFKEAGLFDRSTAASFRHNILEKYGTLDLMAQYKAFRGAEPKLEPLLRRRGLL